MHFDRQILRFGHGWRAGEGFDFVCEALDIGGLPRSEKKSKRVFDYRED